MCGIFGALVNKNTGCTSAFLNSLLNNLFILSQSRGKEAAGIAIYSDNKADIYKEGVIASTFIRSHGYKQFMDRVFNRISVDNIPISEPIAIIGHTRLATHGHQSDNTNNSPVICGRVIGAHNGIVVNGEDILNMFPDVKKTAALDSELIFSLMDFFIKSGLSLYDTLKNIFREIQGSASIAAFILDSGNLILATNTGSLYSYWNKEGDMMIFASEGYILEKLIKRMRLSVMIERNNILQLKPKTACLIDVNKFSAQNLILEDSR